jgi:hypothetical protein
MHKGAQHMPTTQPRVIPRFPNQAATTPYDYTTVQNVEQHALLVDLEKASKSTEKVATAFINIEAVGNNLQKAAR